MFGVSENKNTFPTIGLNNITKSCYLSFGVSEVKIGTFINAFNRRIYW